MAESSESLPAQLGPNSPMAAEPMKGAALNSTHGSESSSSSDSGVSSDSSSSESSEEESAT